jgi:hypothetical protein
MKTAQVRPAVISPHIDIISTHRHGMSSLVTVCSSSTNSIAAAGGQGQSLRPYARQCVITRTWHEQLIDGLQQQQQQQPQRLQEVKVRVCGPTHDNASSHIHGMSS